MKKGPPRVVFYSTYDSRQTFDSADEAWEHDADLRAGEKKPKARFTRDEQRVPTPYTYHRVKSGNVIGDTGAGKWGPHTVAHVDITADLEGAVARGATMRAIFDDQVLAPGEIRDLRDAEYGKAFKPDQALRYDTDYATMHARLTAEFDADDPDQELQYELMMRLMQLHPYTTYGKNKVSHRSTKGKGERQGQAGNEDTGGNFKLPAEYERYKTMRARLKTLGVQIAQQPAVAPAQEEGQAQGFGEGGPMLLDGGGFGEDDDFGVGDGLGAEDVEEGGDRQAGKRGRSVSLEMLHQAEPEHRE